MITLENKSLAQRILILLVLSLLCSSAIYFIAQGFNQRYFKSDAWGYYIYLPSFFIYHDALTMRHAASAIWQYELSHEFFQAMRLDNGNYVFGYTGGVAAMQAPFFFIAHAIATIFGLRADGYSPVYQYFIIVSGFFWGLWGVLNCYRILSRYFGITVSIITCLVLVFATNLYNYMFWENGMTHVYSFFLISACLVGCIDFLAAPAYSRAAALGLALGLLVLIRPTNCIVILPLVLLGTSLTSAALSDRWHFAIRHWQMIGLAAILAVIPFAMQTIYWRWATGVFLFNPYAHIGYKFFFLRAHIHYGLFSVSKGWFFYSPVMLLIFPGLLVMFFRPRVVLHPLVLLLYLSLHVWIVYSWQVYDYGSAYGARPLVDTYALLAIPLGCCLDLLFRRRLSRIFALVTLTLLVANNMVQTWKFDIGYLSGAGYSPREVRRTYFDFDNEGLRHQDPPLPFRPEDVIYHQESTRIQLLGDNESSSDVLSYSFDSIKGAPDQYFLRAEVTGRYGPIDPMRGKRCASVTITQDTSGDYYTWKGYSIPAQTLQGDTALQKIVLTKNIVRPFSPKDVIKCWVMDGSPNKFELHSIRFDIIRK